MYNNNRITCEISNFYVEIDDIQAPLLAVLVVLSGICLIL